MITASRIFKIPPTTLRNSKSRLEGRQNGGHSAILTTTEVAVIQKFVKDMYEAGYPATKRIMFGAITCIRKKQRYASTL